MKYHYISEMQQIDTSNLEVRQSSVLWNGVPKRAIDGDTNGYYGSK